ncbi:hypothetical protein V5O48_019455, partial [Marasmius crinis-equi]
MSTPGSSSVSFGSAGSVLRAASPIAETGLAEKTPSQRGQQFANGQSLVVSRCRTIQELVGIIAEPYSAALRSPLTGLKATFDKLEAAKSCALRWRDFHTRGEVPEDQRLHWKPVQLTTEGMSMASALAQLEEQRKQANLAQTQIFLNAVKAKEEEVKGLEKSVEVERVFNDLLGPVNEVYAEAQTHGRVPKIEKDQQGNITIA